MSPTKDDASKTESRLSAKSERILVAESSVGAGDLEVLKYLCQQNVDREANLKKIEGIMDATKDREVRIAAAKILHQICGRLGGSGWINKGFRQKRKDGAQEESNGQ